MGQHTEVQVSQAFNDGNKDVQWNRGVVFTAKQEDLWTTTSRISTEDVAHMRNRVREFVFGRVMGKGDLKDVTSCSSCMARWIVAGSAQRDAAGGLHAMPTVLPIDEDKKAAMQPDVQLRVAAIVGLSQLLQKLQVPTEVATMLLEDLEELGAARASELTSEDWASLRVWAALRPLQKRRLLQST